MSQRTTQTDELDHPSKAADPINVNGTLIETVEQAIRDHSMSYFKSRQLDLDMESCHISRICEHIDWVEPWRETTGPTTWIIQDSDNRD